jgi:hypothetical protein
MSNYQKERGEVKMPVGEFSKFAKALSASVQTRQYELFDKAVSIYNQIKLEKKGKRNFQVQSRIYEILSPRDNRNSFSFGRSSAPEFDVQARWDIEHSLLKEGKLVKPKKKDFTLDSKERFESSELSVCLDKKTKTLLWRVDENNHSVDDAHESFLGKEVMKLLGRVKFTNRTGGVFRYNDEYRRDDGQGDEISHRFGRDADPKNIKKEYLAQARTARMMAKFTTRNF